MKQWGHHADSDVACTDPECELTHYFGGSDRRWEPGCLFCDYRGPSVVVWDRSSVYAIEPLNPVTEGHLLFIPRDHITQADHPQVADAFRSAAHFAMFYRQRYDHFNLILSVGEDATQTIPHVHVHLVPRLPGDGLHLPWTGQEVDRA